MLIWTVGARLAREPVDAVYLSYRIADFAGKPRSNGSPCVLLQQQATHNPADYAHQHGQQRDRHQHPAVKGFTQHQ